MKRIFSAALLFVLLILTVVALRNLDTTATRAQGATTGVVHAAN